MRCAAFGCNTDSSKPAKKYRQHFFRFPSDSSIREQWIRAMSCDRSVGGKLVAFTPTKHSVLCHRHFEDGCYDKPPSLLQSIGMKFGDFKIRLLPTAVPSIFPEVEQVKKRTLASPADLGPPKTCRQTYGAFEKRKRKETINMLLKENSEKKAEEGVPAVSDNTGHTLDSTDPTSPGTSEEVVSQPTSNNEYQIQPNMTETEVVSWIKEEDTQCGLDVVPAMEQSVAEREEQDDVKEEVDCWQHMDEDCVEVNVEVEEVEEVDTPASTMYETDDKQLAEAEHHSGSSITETTETEITGKHAGDTSVETVGSSTPDCHGSATPDCHGSATPDCHGSATPDCHGSATPDCHGSATPDCHGSATPDCHGSATPDCHGSATPDCHGSATPDCHGSATPDCHGSATPDCHSSATPDCHGSATPDCHGSVTPDCHAGEELSALAEIAKTDDDELDITVIKLDTTNCTGDSDTLNTACNIINSNTNELGKDLSNGETMDISLTSCGAGKETETESTEIDKVCDDGVQSQESDCIKAEMPVASTDSNVAASDVLTLPVLDREMESMVDTEAAVNVDHVQVKTIDIPEDDDLFDFTKVDAVGDAGDVNEMLEMEIEEEVHKGELYRYLTESEGQSNHTHTEEATPIKSYEATPFQSCDATPLPSYDVTPLLSYENTPLQSSDEEGSVSGSSEGSYTSGSDDDSMYTSEDEQEQTETSQHEAIQEESKQTARRSARPKASPVKGGRRHSNVQISSRTLERLEKSQQVTNRWLKDLQVPENLTLTEPLQVGISELNKHLTCGLCKGYLYEASTITECMHTFCKNCIVRHCMEISLHCPVCSILIHPTDPFVNIRLDRMIQDIVYKLLPKVAQDEMEKIKAFYKEHPEVEPQEIQPSPTKAKESPKEKSVTPVEGRVQSHLVSLLLESVGDDDTGELEKKYVRVTGSATLDNVCHFLQSKLNLEDTHQVQLFCCGDMMEEKDCTLKNIQNQFFGNQDCPMLLQYKVRGS